MEISVEPIPKPKPKSESPRKISLVANPGKKSITAINTAAVKVAVLEPTRSINCPTITLADKAPAPRTRSKAPIVE